MLLVPLLLLLLLVVVLLLHSLDRSAACYDWQ
jgi:hypothetical protein